MEFLAAGAAAWMQASRQASLEQTQEYRSSQCSLHPFSVCPSWLDKIIHVGCLTISRKRALEESFLSGFGVIKSPFYSMECVLDARKFSV